MSILKIDLNATEIRTAIIYSSYQSEGKRLLTANLDRSLYYTQRVALKVAATVPSGSGKSIIGAS